MRLNLSLGHFVTMASLKTLFNLSSGIKFLTSVKSNLIQSRGALYICLGPVILEINLPTRSLLVYINVIFLPTCMWSSAHRLFWHLVKKTFSPHNIVVLWFILLDVFVVCNTSGEPLNFWIHELNNMYPQRYGKGTNLLTK